MTNSRLYAHERAEQSPRLLAQLGRYRPMPLMRSIDERPAHGRCWATAGWCRPMSAPPRASCWSPSRAESAMGRYLDSSAPSPPSRWSRTGIMSESCDHRTGHDATEIEEDESAGVRAFPGGSGLEAGAPRRGPIIPAGRCCPRSSGGSSGLRQLRHGALRRSRRSCRSPRRRPTIGTCRTSISGSTGRWACSTTWRRFCYAIVNFVRLDDA
jgi:hypothetical protein